MKRHGSPQTITTDGLRSHRAAIVELGCEDKEEVGLWASNRVENSHLSFRRRERAMLSFRRMASRQKFASVHANVHNHFNSERHLVDAQRTRPSAQLPWLSGTASSPETWPEPARRVPTEANAYWSDSTATS